MSSILAGRFLRNGPFSSSVVIVYCLIAGSLEVAASFDHVFASSLESLGRPCATLNAASAFWKFPPARPSISPGENRARSSRTCALISSGSGPLTFLPGLLPTSAVLMAFASRASALVAMGGRNREQGQSPTGETSAPSSFLHPPRISACLRNSVYQRFENLMTRTNHCPREKHPWIWAWADDAS